MLGRLLRKRPWRRTKVPPPVVRDDATLFYEGLLGPLRLRPVTVLVLADEAQDSLALWHDFFPLATIVAACPTAPVLPERLAARVRVETGDHADPGVLAGLAGRVAPAMVADHRAPGRPGRLAGLRALYGALAPGGVYLIDDLGPATGADGEAAYRFVERLARGLARGGVDEDVAAFLAATDHVGIRGRACVLRKRGRPLSTLRVTAARDLSDPPARSFGRPAYRRGTPELVGAPDWIARAVAQKAGAAVEPPEALVCTLRDAVVFRSGMVRVGDRLVRESLINVAAADEDDALRFAGDRVLVEPGASRRTVAEPTLLLAQRWDENYGHWIVEGLPRIVPAGRVVDLRGLRVALNDHAAMRPVYLDGLKVFGVEPEQVVWLGAEEVAFRELIYPTPLTVQPWVKSPLILEAAERVRAAVAGEAAGGPTRLYVSRNRWGRRRLTNEAEILPLLDRRGYRVVHPETLTFRAQAALFARAERVVGAQGAALANIVFAPEGLRLLALTNQDMVDDFFFDLTSLKGGRYHALHGTSAQPERGMQSDFAIDAGQLERCLNAWDF